MLKAVIFDMDGVLIDSEIIYATMFKDFVMKELQAPLDPQIVQKEIYKFVGKPDNDLLEWVAQKLNGMYSLEDIEEHHKKHWETFSLDYKTILNPHVLNILPRLKAHGFTLAIASSSPLENIRKVMADCGIEEYFDVVMSGEEFKESKPNPEIYLKTLEKLGVKAKDAIAIEDSTYGIHAAIAANLKVIALEDTRFGFDQSQATFMVKDLLSAYELIRSI